MSAPVLIAYATRYGSTQEVAEIVAATLRDDGLEVDIQPMRDVRTLAGYSAVVLGAPLYVGHLHKDALQFLSRHREDLGKRPVAMFALGPISGSPDGQEWQGARTMLEEELAAHPWLTPVALELFGGKYDPARLRIPDKLIAKLPASPLHGLPANDLRDWTSIRAWASTLTTQLQPATEH